MDALLRAAGYKALDAPCKGDRGIDHNVNRDSTLGGECAGHLQSVGDPDMVLQCYGACLLNGGAIGNGIGKGQLDFQCANAAAYQGAGYFD